MKYDCIKLSHVLKEVSFLSNLTGGHFTAEKGSSADTKTIIWSAEERSVVEDALQSVVGRVNWGSWPGHNGTMLQQICPQWQPACGGSSRCSLVFMAGQRYVGLHYAVWYLPVQCHLGDFQINVLHACQGGDQKYK